MWKNWAGEQVCTPAHRAMPTSVDEVSAVVRASAERGDVVRVYGAGHSFGDNCLTDGTLMSLDGLKGLKHVDRETGLVRVAAGTRLFELNAALDQHGLALAVLGDINVQSLAGAVSTGTHGTGIRLGNLATLVESLELVTADGSVRELSGEELRAARISVGALGVVTAYTLRTVPAYKLEDRRALTPLPQLLAELDERVQSNDHFEFFIFPHASKALTKDLNRTYAPATASGRRRAWFEEVVVENYALDLISRTGRRFPRQIPRLNRFVTSIAGGSTKVGRSHDVFSAPRSVRFTEAEWAFPREACVPAFKEIMALAERHNMNFPLEVRFVAGDTESMLSPAYGRETAYIAVHSYRGMPWKEYLAGVSAIAAEYDARPHWGKRHDLDAETFSGLYPEWDAFQAVRKDLDPEGVFANEHVRRIFG